MHNFLVSILTFNITGRGNVVISMSTNSVKNRLMHILPTMSAINLLVLCPVPLTQTIPRCSSEVNVHKDLFLTGSLAAVILHFRGRDFRQSWTELYDLRGRDGPCRIKLHMYPDTLMTNFSNFWYLIIIPGL